MAKRTLQRVSDLIPDSKNANRGTERGSAALEKSIERLGLGRSVLIDKHGVIIAGNKTVERAVQAGIEKLTIVPSDGTTLIAVQRTDLSLEKDKMAKELAIADNRVAEINLDWDPEVLTQLNADIELAVYFSDKELVQFLALGDGKEAPEPKLDQADELQDKWKIARGQIWEIPGQAGVHRLRCGDATQKSDTAALLGKALPRMAFTDPPYNVNFGASDHPSHRKRKITNDHLGDKDWSDFTDSWMRTLIQSVDGGIYICMSDKELGSVTESFKREGGHWSSYVIWVKDRLVLGMKDYHSRHETILYGWRDGASHFFIDDRTKTDIWEVDRPSSSELHPTMKPVELVRMAIDNSSEKGDVVLDVFTGAGSTLIAAEQAARIGYGLEIEPKYVAVTLERLSEMGLEPRLVSE